MQFHIQLIDNPDASARREKYREDHWAYFDAHADHFIARGATFTDDLKQFISSVLFVEFPGWDEVRAFIEDEPLNRNGVFHTVHIHRWMSGLKRRQRDFPGDRDQVCWYIRGFGAPSVHEQRMELLPAHIDYFRPYDVNNFIARGPIMSDDGEEWHGSANLIALPSREALEAFMAEEPYNANGLYARLVYERYRFGGRPGQKV